MQVAVLGLGEAGGRLAVDLAAAGCTVRGFDPQRRPAGVENADSGRGAVAEADVVLSVNAAAVALDAQSVERSETSRQCSEDAERPLRP